MGVKRRMFCRRSKGDQASTCYVDDNIYFYIIQPLACQVRGADFAIINCEGTCLTAWAKRPSLSAFFCIETKEDGGRIITVLALFGD